MSSLGVKSVNWQVGLNLDDPGSAWGRGSVFTDNLTAHATAAVEMQQVVSNDKMTLDLQVSS